jgi:Flp pilus assembly secretin CpaC
MKKFNEDEAYQELEEREVKQFEEHEEIRQILSASKKIHKTIKVQGVDVQIRAFMPRSVRLKLLKLGNALKAAKTAEEAQKAESAVYPILAEMCIEDPYNTAKLWVFLDKEIGCAQQAVIDIMEAVNSTDKQIEDFRGKR